MTPNYRHVLIGAGLLVWMAAVAYGFTSTWQYDTAPGEPADARHEWPAKSIAFNRERPNLVTVLHPECVCSGATLEEVSRLKAEFGGRLAVFVIVDASATGVESKAADSLVRAIKSMPGVKLVIDHAGQEVERFGAKVSGQAFLYDSKGRLQFSGGITMSRGHVGPNAGTEAIRHYLHGEPAVTAAAVFGCILPRGGRS